MSEKVSMMSKLLQALGRLPGLSFLESYRRRMDSEYHRVLQQVDDAKGTRDDFQHAGQVVTGDTEGDEESRPETSLATEATSPPSSTSAGPDAGGPQPQESERGTMMMDALVLTEHSSAPPPATEVSPTDSGSTAATSPPSDRGTLMLQTPLPDVPVEPTSVTYQAAPDIDDDQPPLVSPADSDEQLLRLEYVCQLLRQARQPLCPINGILTLLPLKTIRAGSRESQELQRATRADVLTVQRELQMRCPVTALIVGLEEDPGFGELVRRVGPEKAAAQRFGKRFDVRSLATPNQLAAFCIHIGGVFEDWIYTLFREQGALTRPGNTRLYGLLCQVRSRLQRRLTHILVGSFGFRRERQFSDDPIAFSGCYFAATGQSEDRRSFVRGVFDKLVEEQENVEWTRQAIAGDRRTRWLGYLGVVASASLATWLAIKLFATIF